MIYKIPKIEKLNKIKDHLMQKATSKNKLLNNANYNEKCNRKTIIFRPVDKDLFDRLEDEKGNISELVRNLLKQHFETIDDNKI